MLHESNLVAMTPGELYDATVSAVLRERGLDWADVEEIARELRRVERRRYAVNAMPGRDGSAGMEIRRRLSVEAEVLEWAMEETEAALRPENQYGAR